MSSLSERYEEVLGGEVFDEKLLGVRAGYSNFARSTVVRIARMLFNKDDFVTTTTALIDIIQNLYDGKVLPQDLLITRTVANKYFSNRSCMKIYSEKLKKEGRDVKPMDKLQFLVVKGESYLLGDNLRSIEHYTVYPELIDYDYYLERELKSMIDALFSARFKDMTLPNITYRGGIIYFNQPIRFILKSKRLNISLNDLKQILSSTQNISP